MQVLFINGSPNKTGNTAALAKTMMGGMAYETLNLVDYKIYAFGQSFPDDQFREVVDRMMEADVVILGSPVYWHNMCGAVRNLLDRFYGAVEEGAFKGRRLFLLYQGAAPEKWMLDAGEYTVSRFCSIAGFQYMGMANNRQQAKKLGEKL